VQVLPIPQPLLGSEQAVPIQRLSEKGRNKYKQFCIQSTERGDCMKKEPVIENFIEIDGKDVLIDSLPVKERERIGILIQDRMMELVGYRRKNASG